jgi:hypothetical protein
MVGQTILIRRGADALANFWVTTVVQAGEKVMFNMKVQTTRKKLQEPAMHCKI